MRPGGTQRSDPKCLDYVIISTLWTDGLQLLMYIAEGTYLGTAGTRPSCGMSWGLNYTYTGPGLRLAKPSL